MFNMVCRDLHLSDVFVRHGKWMCCRCSSNIWLMHLICVRHVCHLFSTACHWCAQGPQRRTTSIHQQPIAVFIPSCVGWPIHYIPLSPKEAQSHFKSGFWIVFFQVRVIPISAPEKATPAVSLVSSLKINSKAKHLMTDSDSKHPEKHWLSLGIVFFGVSFGEVVFLWLEPSFFSPKMIYRGTSA